jgi:hypothetical protein
MPLRPRTRNGANLTHSEEDALCAAIEGLHKAYTLMRERPDRDEKLTLLAQNTGRRLARTVYRKGTMGYEKFDL